MCTIRSVWILFPVSVGVLISQVAAQQPSAPGPGIVAEKKDTPSAPRLDEKGAAWLRDAINALDPKSHPWIEANLWQQVDVHGLYFQADGLYLSGPDHRLRVELNLKWGDATGSLLSVCDGATIWERLQLGSKGVPRINKTDLKKLKEALGAPGVAEAIRKDFWNATGFMGVAPLLQQIQQQMTVTNHQRTTWHGHDVVKLTAFWSENTAKTLVQPNRPWPAFLPRKCYLYLGAADGPAKYWPYRLEWWGPTPTRTEDTLLIQMELRAPKLDQPLPADRVAKEFRFDPGDAKVDDLTDLHLRAIKAQK